MTQSLRYYFEGNPSLVPGDESPTTTPDLSITRATSATVVDSNGLIHEVSSGVARFDGATYSGDTASGTSNGLLVEEARTNICLRSEDFLTTWNPTNANTTAGTVANQGTAPDGSNTAHKLLDSAGGGSGGCDFSQIVSVSTSTKYTFSVFAKEDQLNWLILELDAFTTPVSNTRAWFNLASGTLGASPSAGIDDTGIEDYGNGWYRCWIVFTTDSSDTTGSVGVKVTDSDGISTIAIDGTSSIFVWGAQLEAGAFPTSYIPTTTASVTRNADVVSVADVSWNDASVGSIYVHAEANNVAAAEQCMVEISDGSTSDRIQLLSAATDGSFDVETFTTTGTDGAIAGTQDFAAATASRAVAGYANNDVIAYLDGTSDGTEASATLPPSVALTTLTVGSNQDSEYWNGLIKEIRYYDERIDNTGLENLSNGLFPIPDVVDYTSAGATTLLEANGFVADTTTTAYSDSIAVGNVISQDGAAGTYAANGTTVTLTISLGPEPSDATGGWLNTYNAYQQRKAAQEKARKEILQKVRELDGIDGEIAELMQLDQAREDEDKRIAEFRALLDKEISKAELDKAGLLNKRINRAYDRAMKKATFSAIEALEREIEDAIEEEEFAFLVLTLN